MTTTLTPIEKHVVAAIEFAENMYINYTIYNMVLPTIAELNKARSGDNIDAETLKYLDNKEELVFTAIPWLSVGEA